MFGWAKIEGERFPLARTPLLATPSPRGSAPKTPIASALRSYLLIVP